jgi:flagellar hook-associated protein 3 FlgL
MQTALGNVDQLRESSSNTLLKINGSSLSFQIDDAGRSAMAGFEGTVQSLNMRSGDRSIFGGNDFDQNALAAPSDMIDALKVAIAGLSEANDITVAIDTWFDTPGGGFETEGYQGDVSGFIERSVDASLKVEIPIRADDETLRDTLKAFAIGALAGEADVTISQDTRRALLRQSAEDLLSVGAPLAGARGRLGFIEAQIDEAATRNAAQETSYSIVRNTLVSADPFETATRLEAVQTQLETHFTLTARLSRLSLTEYLR